MAAAGTTTVAWTQQAPDRGRIDGLYDVGAATAAPDTAFAVQRVATRVQEVSRPALSVAPDGWALLAYDETGGVHVLERPARAARFTPAFDDTPPDERPSEADMPVVAVRDGGGGLVAWRSGYDDATAGTIATMRAAAGAFPAPRTVAPGAGSADDFGDAAAVFTTTGTAGAPDDGDNGALRAAMAPDGRVLLAWRAERRSVMTTHVAAGTLAEGLGAPVRLGSPVRDVNGVAPLFLADGRAAVAWTDNATVFGFGLPTDNGRVHVAVESVPAMAEPDAPGVRLTGRRTQHLFDSQPIRLGVACDSACDVRAVLSGRRSDSAPLTRSLSRAGAMRLSLYSYDMTSRTRPQRRLRVLVRASAPGGHAVTTVSLRVLVVRRPALPVPAPLDVRAVRRGGSIVVSWRTASPARRASYTVIGQRRRRLSVETLRDPGLFDYVEGRGRTRFTVRLQSERPSAVHWVAIYGISLDQGRAPSRVLVPVR
jgi:hypothetical protein